MKKKSEAPSTLLELIQGIGIPSVLRTDGAKELHLGKWNDICDDLGIKQTITEPYSPWQNHAKINIREAKKAIHRLMTRNKTPKAPWDYCATYVAEITCITANDLCALHGGTPYEMVTGNTPDISEYVEFIWYDPVFYYDDTPFPQGKHILAQWLSVAHQVGQAMCYWLLTQTGQVIARTSVQNLTLDELFSPDIKQAIHDFDISVHDILKSHEIRDDNPTSYLQDVYDDLDEPFDEKLTMPEQDEYPDHNTYDQYLSTHVLLPRGDHF